MKHKELTEKELTERLEKLRKDNFHSYETINRVIKKRGNLEYLTGFNDCMRMFRLMFFSSEEKGRSVFLLDEQHDLIDKIGDIIRDNMIHECFEVKKRIQTAMKNIF